MLFLPSNTYINDSFLLRTPRKYQKGSPLLSSPNESKKKKKFKILSLAPSILALKKKKIYLTIDKSIQVLFIELDGQQELDSRRRSAPLKIGWY